MPTKIQGGLGIDKVQDGTVGMSDVDTELYGKITALTTINLGEAKTATGTVVDFDVPEGVKRVTVMFDGVSTNGTSTPQIQLGTIGGFDSSNYKGAVVSSGGASKINFSTGFALIGGNLSSVVLHGLVCISKINSNDFVESSVMGRSDDSITPIGAGSKSLSGPLTKLRVTTVNGTDQFDAGTINISWEF